MCGLYPVIAENFINTWLAVLSVCLCYKMLLENMHEVEQNGNQQREQTEYTSLLLQRDEDSEETGNGKSFRRRDKKE